MWTLPGPAASIRLDPQRNKTFYYWHIFVPGLRAGQLYGYRAYGPFQPHDGFRFDPGKVLLDPYGRGVMVSDHYDRHAAARPGDNCARAMKSVVVDPHAYDWEGDRRAGLPLLRQRHLRTARGRLHPTSLVGRQPARHLCWA